MQAADLPNTIGAGLAEIGFICESFTSSSSTLRCSCGWGRLVWVMTQFSHVMGRMSTSSAPFAGMICGNIETFGYYLWVGLAAKYEPILRMKKPETCAALATDGARGLAQNRHFTYLTFPETREVLRLPNDEGWPRDRSRTNASGAALHHLTAAAFLGNISPMRRIWAPTPFNFSSMCS